MTSKFNYKKIYFREFLIRRSGSHLWNSREILKESYSDNSECCNDLDPCVCKIKSINMISSDKGLMIKSIDNIQDPEIQREYFTN